MALDISTSPVYDALNTLHADESIFSFGISDTTNGIRLYKPGKKPACCDRQAGKNRAAAALQPGSRRRIRAPGAPQVRHLRVQPRRRGGLLRIVESERRRRGKNGDNLLEIHDKDVATVFAIEGLGTVDHFNFLNRYADGGQPAASPQAAAVAAEWFLSTTDRWTLPYLDPDDLKCVDRCCSA